MQNKYVGDIGDLAKHGLLRRLCGLTDEETNEADLTIGLVWYWHHDEKHGQNPKKISGDGRHIGYLRRTRTDDKSEYRNCDIDLWEKLRDLVYRDARCVHCAELAGLLPESTSYHSTQLTLIPGNTKKLKELRIATRQHWLEEALQVTEGTDIVCLDPDNGIAPEVKMFRAGGTKYVYLSDLREFWGRGQSLVVYHHLGMDAKAPKQAKKVAALLRDGLEGNPNPIPLLFRRGSSRVFFVVPNPKQPETAATIRARVDRLLASCWNANGHFRLV